MMPVDVALDGLPQTPVSRGLVLNRVLEVFLWLALCHVTEDVS